MGKYALVSKPFAAYKDSTTEHHGTGFITARHRMVAPWTVELDIKKPFEFPDKEYSVRVMCFEIATAEAPNWFGVSYRKGLQTFDSVNIFCHPYPGKAGMDDGTYQTRSGNWPKLFRYAEMLGRQIDAAKSDQVVIVPFFNNATYGSTGLFGPNWKDIVTDILTAARQDTASPGAQSAWAPANVVGRAANGAGAGAGAGAAGAGAGASAAAAAANGAPPAAPVALKKVVLSDFSRGRRLMLNVRANAPGLSSYLNEIWDFDGNDGALPTPTRDVRVIHYNQAHARGTWDNFHVPATRWEGFHGKELANRADANVHSNIPDMLGWHAAAVSGVGKMYGHETF